MIYIGLRSKLPIITTLSRFLLSGGLYWKVKYVSRLQCRWHDMKKGSIEIPDFVAEHDEVLEKRPRTDYGIEPDPLHFTELPSNSFTYGSTFKKHVCCFRYSHKQKSTEQNLYSA
ncbi:SEC14 cytosolic factor family protein / phosphoglyceride transfer family protein [Artemisia annua]|uniref:SEC14 cytosolic factor family protein / phosphoglyceride transfer family protein n=1 Tax=Artemisia annua TaxID=35608 RepID=A0A2U1P1K4_ARTAN|nr:SEC14 cytosolic factor family protein / phosphoglyceride transfer family protein [Artemisia annua]